MYEYDGYSVDFWSKNRLSRSLFLISFFNSVFIIAAKLNRGSQYFWMNLMENDFLKKNKNK